VGRRQDSTTQNKIMHTPKLKGLVLTTVKGSPKIKMVATANIPGMVQPVVREVGTVHRETSSFRKSIAAVFCAGKNVTKGCAYETDPGLGGISTRGGGIGGPRKHLYRKKSISIVGAGRNLGKKRLELQHRSKLNNIVERVEDSADRGQIWTRNWEVIWGLQKISRKGCFAGFFHEG